MGYTLGMAVVMVMAALAVTTEYSVGTIRTTFLAMPHRGPSLLAKTIVVAVLASLIGLVIALSSWAIGLPGFPDADLALTGATAMATGRRGRPGLRRRRGHRGRRRLPVRHTAGAVAIVLVWRRWPSSFWSFRASARPRRPFLPFQAAKQFLSAE